VRRVDRAGALVLQLESLLRGRLAETRRDWQQLRSDVKQEPEQRSADGFPPKNGNSVRSIQWLGYLRIFGIQSTYSFFPISLLHWYQELADFQQLCNRRFEDCLHNLEVA
jgi:hypothetical protein